MEGLGGCSHPAVIIHLRLNFVIVNPLIIGVVFAQYRFVFTLTLVDDFNSITTLHLDFLYRAVRV